MKILSFEKGLLDDFVSTKAKQYKLKPHTVKMKVQDLQMHGWNILLPKHRHYMDSCLALFAVNYHSGRSLG